MKSYDESDVCVDLLKEAVEIFSKGEVFHDTLSRSAHIKGLQGFKRWHEKQSDEDRHHRIKTQHYSIDQFGVDINPLWDSSIKIPGNIEKHLGKYLEWEIYVYKSLSEIGNELMNRGFAEESILVLSPLEGVRKEIKNIRRWIQDFEFTGYNPIYIKLVDKLVCDKSKEQ